VKVFISWSGEPSHSIARALHAWLPSIAQHVDPWMSDEEIKSGTRWNERVAKALDETDFGIVCVSASNQHRPWLMFEAGALAKRLEAGRVVPLCIDLVPAEVTGPLEAFQGRTVDRDGIRRLVQDIMGLREKPPPQVQVDQLFEALWGALESKVNEAKQQSPELKKPKRTAEEMLEELVDRMRRLERIQPSAVEELAYLTHRLERMLRRFDTW
jgi:TIR domain